jgi:flagellar hook-associated protein 2
MGIPSPGIGSNLPIDSIIAKLMQAESRPLTVLAKKEASYQAKLSAFGNLSGALGAFQNALGSLNSQSTFQSLTATSADSTIFTAAATPKASAGSYNVNVTQLAQSQTISSGGQSSMTATIGGGTTTKLTFEFGTIAGGKLQNGQYVSDPAATPPAPTFSLDPNQASGTVTIDNTNNSLQGIRDAINKANLGVTASIVSDGSATPYHLVITSNKTGAASSMKIAVQGAEPALTNMLAYDPAGTQNMTQSTAAQSAALTVNGIAVTSQTNTVNGAVEGVTLNVSKVGSSSLSIARNTSTVQSAVSGFVKAYNDLQSTIKKLSSYDPATEQAGILLGDSSVRNIDSQLRKMLSTVATGSNSNLKTLSQAGIAIDKNGMMSLDTGKLSTAMNNNMTDVAALFSSVGTTTDSLVSFVSATSSSSPGDQAVFLSKLATQGKVVGSIDLRMAPITIDNTNKDMALTVDGVTASVSLTPGAAPYSAAQLAVQVQSAINSASAFSSAGIAVSVTIGSNGFLNITSNKYGSDSKVTATGSAVTALMSTATPTDGIDVAGTIGGVPATGSGQYLTGASGSPAAGLKLQITGGAENASRGTVSFSQGQAFHLNALLEGYLGSGGLLAGRTDGINSSIKGLGNQSDVLNARLTAMEKRYRAQFTALDVTIGKMTSTSSFLTQQLAQFTNMSKQ